MFKVERNINLFWRKVPRLSIPLQFGIFFQIKDLGNGKTKELV